MADTLWYNGRCTKCRQALELLKAREHEVRVREYLVERPTAAEVEALIRKLGNAARDIVRTGEPEYADSGLTPLSSPQDIARAIEKTPTLLQRPILETPTRAIIGRPPERITELL